MTLNLKLKRHYKAYLLLGYAFLLIVHFILKDRFFPLSILFYASPLPIILCITFFLVVLFFRRRNYRNALLVTSVVLGCIWCNSYYFFNSAEPQPNTSKVLFWNLAKKNQLPVSYISEKVNSYQPEILAFVEVTSATLSNLDSLKRTLPTYNFKILKGAMLVASTGNIEIVSVAYGDNSHKANLLKVKTHSNTFDFIITDLTASLLVNKQKPMTFLSNFAKINSVDFIVGDFNTPYESVFFSMFSSDYKSFHGYNTGFSSTWPLGIPLLEIDHFWLSHKHEPIQLYKFYNKASDHALLISEFKFSNY
jgi:hypothetical protein